MNLNLPTFEEFKRNRSRYIKPMDEDFGLIDRGSQNLNRMVKRHVYEIEGYRCKSLEEVERRANAMGIPINKLDYRASIVPLSGHKCDILVKFMPKHEIERRDQW